LNIPSCLISFFIKIPNGFYTGTFSSPKTIEQIQREVEMVKDKDYQGVAFFCWETTLWLFKGSTASQVKQVFQQLFG
jgi:uncharacterized lipoprotein YddW (UPF0748 family)